MEKKRILILGAAGRDFHDFNVLFRSNKDYEVVGFTANQIPYISDRKYPKELSGPLYPSGISIYEESGLKELIKTLHVDICIIAYSDLSYHDVMTKASIVNAAGADFWVVAPSRTMLKSSKPVIAVCGVRTGVGKSQTSRYIAKFLREKGYKVGVIRHPMPYGILKNQIAERFATLKDLDKYNTTIEEREDYEPHIKNRFIVYAGVDYEKVMKLAEKESDIIIWDGGNNDSSFLKPNLTITVVDPLRAGAELDYYPGETCAMLADILLVNKVDSASKEDLERVTTDLDMINDTAMKIMANSDIGVDNKTLVKGKSVLLVEDGPTITHGGMRFGAAFIASKKFGAKEIVDARKYIRGTLKDTFKKYPHLGKELPAMGYSEKQIKDLEETINLAECDVVLSATPTDLKRIVKVNKPIVQVSYELDPIGKDLDRALEDFVKNI